jgi:hypothetical protein
MNNSQKVATTLGLILAAIMLCSGALFFGYAYGHNNGYQAGYTSGQGLAATQQSVQWEKESYQAGYKDGHDSVQKEANIYKLHNPTYDEMMNFLAADPANNKQYVEDQHMCVDFVAEVKNHAEAQGIRCAMVYIMNSEGIGHTIVAFETTDRGLQFVEPQYDRVVKLVVGESYSQLNNFMPEPNDDVIRRYVIIW